MKTLLDPKKNGEYPFRYVPAVGTNIRETFERARRRIAEPKVLALPPRQPRK